MGYDPNEARDDRGRWSSGGGGNTPPHGGGTHQKTGDTTTDASLAKLKETDYKAYLDKKYGTVDNPKPQAPRPKESIYSSGFTFAKTGFPVGRGGKLT